MALDVLIVCTIFVAYVWLRHFQVWTIASHRTATCFRFRSSTLMTPRCFPASPQQSKPAPRITTSLLPSPTAMPYPLPSPSPNSLSSLSQRPFSIFLRPHLASTHSLCSTLSAVLNEHRRQRPVSWTARRSTSAHTRSTCATSLHTPVRPISASSSPPTAQWLPSKLSTTIRSGCDSSSAVGACYDSSSDSRSACEGQRHFSAKR